MSEKIYTLVYAFSDYGLVINFLQPVLIISLMILGKVNGVKFSYRDDHNQACYNKIKGLGGVITHNGQQVKIYYVNGCIVEL